ncbi:MAG: divalent metal cation transporter FieF [Chromatiales bacterium]|nr:cation diffusion facilitator family transporter [Chromatiales bacterium]PLX54750.1 MAG: divalent metal cation transporter FieF [Chromatiales bacterium]
MPEATEKNATLLKRVTLASTLTALVLIALKLVTWLWTGSVSMLASLVDSAMDAIASLINLLAVRYALVPADDDHRFGHGKAESLAGLAQAAFISGSALFLLLHAVDRILHPAPVQRTTLGIAVIVFSLALTLALLTYQRYVIRHTGSVAIRADALHYATDVLSNLGVIAALLLAQFGLPIFDPILAIAIAGYILIGAWRIGRDSLDHLMDRELDDAVREGIKQLALEHTEVRGIHELRTRRAGQTSFIQLHLEMEPQLTLAEAHAIADMVEAQIRAAVPASDVIIHQDPWLG